MSPTPSARSFQLHSQDSARSVENWFSTVFYVLAEIFSDTSSYLFLFFTEHSERKLTNIILGYNRLGEQFWHLMDCESGSSARKSDETDYETDEEALGKISQKPFKISETLLSKSKRQILICTVFETIFQFMWQFLELFKKTYEIWDRGNSPSSMLRGRSPLLSSGIKYFVENIRWLQNNLFLDKFLPSQCITSSYIIIVAFFRVIFF